MQKKVKHNYVCFLWVMRVITSFADDDYIAATMAKINSRTKSTFVSLVLKLGA